MLHIGPPKTATTSLQESIIPFLGRPFQIKPAWVKDVSRKKAFRAAVDVPAGAIVSDERLGSFWTFPPTVIADRLSVLFEKSTIIYTRRSPTELFYSFYRQVLMNSLALWPDVANAEQRLRAGSADEFFNHTLTQFQRSGIGFFAMVDVPRVRAAFERYFKFEVIDFDLLKSAPAAFVEAFTVASGSTPTQAPIAHINRTASDTIGPRIESLRGVVPDDVLAEYDHAYHHSVLSPARAAILAKLAKARDIGTFVNVFKLRRRDSGR